MAPLALVAVNTAAALEAVPEHEEPLHVVAHRGAHFTMIYSNRIEPGLWTRYHQHRNDLCCRWMQPRVRPDADAGERTPVQVFARRHGPVLPLRR
jgi:hypothetical protein